MEQFNTTQCPTLNGTLQCPNGATIGVFEDTCTFSCNAGYELQGSNNGTCLANQSWSWSSLQLQLCSLIAKQVPLLDPCNS